MSTVSIPRYEFAMVNPKCVVCGAENGRGLHVEFKCDAEGVTAIWVPDRELESFRGTIHGGITGAVLDEAMSKALLARNWKGMTAELRVRYRKKIAPEDRLAVRGWIVERRRRLVRTEATLVGSDGRECAHAWGIFLM